MLPNQGPTTVSRRTFLATLGVWSTCGGPAVMAQQTSRSWRVIVAAPPGGTPDLVARRFGNEQTSDMSVLVDNRPGAGGLIAVSALMQSPADGSVTLLGHSGLVTMYGQLYTRLPYNPEVDLVPVAPAAETAFGIAVGPAVPAEVTTLPEYVRWARADPARASYGTPGMGTLPHILGALLAVEGAFEARHIAYSGGPPAIADLVGGRLSAVVLPDGLLRPLHEAGRLRILATSGAARQPLLPLVPTVLEQGFGSLVMSEWWGLFVSRQTPADRIDALSSAMASAARSPALVAALEPMGLKVLGGTPADMAARLARERARWRELLPATGIRLG
jgi:tripartite-type tricarboxylate transporter receptor subunit TctC